MNNNITSGPTGSSGPGPGPVGPDKRWIRMIRIHKMLKLWESGVN